MLKFPLFVIYTFCVIQAVFGRYPLPEKDYLSFSLVYRNKNDERTLDLVCISRISTNNLCKKMNILF